ncbi:phytoene synthase [Rhodovulum sulfidophilum]|uniref:Squalene/phytoene synthase family protein n=1 Tax=Rhodovulum visakhapatnamense TaxID=364297 RepID=A0ABS1RKR6_9RHOB|nr:squalene/phytoene synthase family protein [Rhodovulum visakhapatnamense]MBL3570416.1 squalene/phytoene synthase family protein [Rhodovulum visakhapatnamense]MBL3580240.1 squalene/phytoene synthase family protein [Rhodovulum visakhapatnamense]OLS46056.1 phytoene synthase [Rhodovulum sulfidophilum]
MTLEACAEIVRKGDPDRFLAVMAAPVAARTRLLPLYAFNVEVARAPWVTEEPLIAEMRLQWWLDALEEIADGGPVRRHEVATPLSEVLAREAARDLLPLVQARRWDAYREPFADGAALEAHLAATSGRLMGAAARVLGAEDGQAALADLGLAMGLAGWFLAVPALLARGRQPLPDDRPEAIADLARSGLARLAAARAAGLPARAIPAARTAWRTGAILKRAAARPDRVRGGGLEEAEVARRAGLLRRALTGGW